MTSNISKNRIVGGVLAAALIASVAAPTVAKADRWHHHHRGGGGGTAAAVVGVGALGLIAGTAIANSNARHSRDDDECFLERRRYVDDYGRTYFKRVEVCE
ncbi:MAG: hypothetical protein ABW275_01990 [Hansschlegelia sp.]